MSQLSNNGMLPSQRYGERLRLNLKLLHITQEAFSEVMHVDVKTVGRWINNGIHDVDTIDEIFTVLKVLGLRGGSKSSLDDDEPFLFRKLAIFFQNTKLGHSLVFFYFICGL